MKTTTTLAFFFCFLAVAYGQTAPVGSSCTCDNPLQLATFNTLQIPIAGERSERLTATINYFENNNENFDVICMQELWAPSDRASVISGLNSSFPYSVQGERRTSTCRDDCSATDSENILNCLFVNDCLNSGGLDVLRCIATQCNLDDTVSESCEDCVFSLRTGLTPESKLRNCAGAREVNDDVLTSCQYLFNGETDVLLLSRYPVIQSAVEYYNVSPFTVWSVIYAEIEHPTLGTIDTFCTHTVADQPFLDLSEESFAQTMELLSFINNRTQGRTDRKVFIMGDFNFGPETSNTNDLFEDSYNMVVDSGYTDSAALYADRTGTSYNCTLCSENRNRAVLAKNDYAIDHIFVNEDANVCLNTAEIFLKERLVTAPDGTEIELSDHYGVRGVYCPFTGDFGSVNDIGSL